MAQADVPGEPRIYSGRVGLAIPLGPKQLQPIRIENLPASAGPVINVGDTSKELEEKGAAEVVVDAVKALEETSWDAVLKWLAVGALLLLAGFLGLRWRRYGFFKPAKPTKP